MRSHVLVVWLVAAVLMLAAVVPPLLAQPEPEPPAEPITEPAQDGAALPTTGSADTGETEAPATGEEAGAETEPAEPPPPRVTFDLKLDEAGGGRAQGSAGNFEYVEDRFLIATDGVELRYQDLRLQADRARIDVEANLITAEGNVVLDEGPRRLTGESLEYDLDTRTGRITQASAFIDPAYYFEGDEIAKIGDATYSVTDGTFTSCEGDPVPDWSIQLSSARVTIDEYARIKNARLKIKRVPIVYFPYILWPAKTDRSSGFLVPKPGYSQRRGGYLGLAYFQTFGRSADATLFADLYSKEFYGFGAEVRYTPSERSAGILRGYFLSEPLPDPGDIEEFPRRDPNREDGDDRWKINYYHETKELFGRFKGVIAFEDYSDFDYLQDYERNVSTQSRSFIYSNAYLSSNVGRQSFNVLIDQRELILRNGDIDQRRQLPEVEYRLRPTQIGRAPLYLSLLSSLHYFSIERLVQGENGQNFSVEYGRADLFPTLSIPLSTLPWLSAKVDLSGRVTHYTDSLTEDFRDFSGDSLTRVFPQAGLEIVGPSFSRIFNVEFGRFAKLKHIIEPRIAYGYTGDFDDQQRISFFDEIDILRPGNGAIYSITQRFLAKPADESEGGAFEIASFSLAQGFSYDDEQPSQISRNGMLFTQEGPIVASLRVNSSPDTSFKADVVYNTLFDDIDSLSFSGGTTFGRQGVGVTWYRDLDAETGDPRFESDQARLFTKFSLVPDKLTLDAELSYDLEAKELLQQRYFVNWQSQCYGLQLELRESKFFFGVNAFEVVDRDFRFSFTLKHVGTFLDLTGGLGS